MTKFPCSYSESGILVFVQKFASEFFNKHTGQGNLARLNCNYLYFLQGFTNENVTYIK